MLWSATNRGTHDERHVRCRNTCWVTAFRVWARNILPFTLITALVIYVAGLRVGQLHACRQARCRRKPEAIREDGPRRYAAGMMMLLNVFAWRADADYVRRGHGASGQAREHRRVRRDRASSACSRRSASRSCRRSRSAASMHPVGGARRDRDVHAVRRDPGFGRRAARRDGRAQAVERKAHQGPQGPDLRDFILALAHRLGRRARSRVRCCRRRTRSPT